MDLVGLQISTFLFGNVHDHGGTVTVTLTLTCLVVAVGSAGPVNGGRIGIGLGDQFNRVAYHKGRVKTKAKVTDDTVVLVISLVFFHKFQRSGKGNLANIAIQLLGGHADSVVGYGKGLGALIQNDLNAIGLIAVIILTKRSKPLELGDGIGGIGDDLAEKNILFGIKPFFDDGEDMLGLYRDSSFFN